MTAFLAILLSLLIVSSVSEGSKCRNEGEICSKTVFQRCCGRLVCDLSGFAKGNQKALDPYKKALTNSSVAQFVQKKLLRNALEGLFDIDVDGVNHIAIIACFGPAFERKEQIRETGPTTSKAVLGIGEEAVMLEELHQGRLNDLLHDFATDGACLEHAAASPHKEYPADQEVSLKPDTSEWTTITESPPMQWRWTDSRRDEERSEATDAEQCVSRTSATSKGGSGTLEGNLSGSWDTRTPMHQEAWECGADCGGNDGSSCSPSTWSQLLACNECPGKQAMNIRAPTTGPMPSSRSRRLAPGQSSPPVPSTATAGAPSTSLTLPATQFTPSVTRPSPRPRNTVVTTALRSQLLPTPLPPPPPSPPTQPVLVAPTSSPPLPSPPSSGRLVYKPLRRPPRPPSPPTPPAHQFATPSPPITQASMPMLTLNALTPSPPPPSSSPPPPPPSPPPPLYISEYLPVEQADSVIDYRREICASDLPVRGGGDSPRNPQLLLPRIGDAGRTNVKGTQTTPVVNSGDRFVQTLSPPAGVLFS
ncbi:hypothetical protein SprV_0200615300 [Sparganum proliferum]